MCCACENAAWRCCAWCLLPCNPELVIQLDTHARDVCERMCALCISLSGELACGGYDDSGAYPS